MLVCDQIPDGPKQDEIQDTIRGAQAKEAIHDAVMKLKREQILALVQALGTRSPNMRRPGSRRPPSSTPWPTSGWSD